MILRYSNQFGVVIVIAFFGILLLSPKLRSSTTAVSIPYENQVANEEVLNRPLKVIQGPKEWGATITLNTILKKHRSAIINFWATWCPPCIDELPTLEYLNRELKGSIFPPIITLSVDESPNDVLALFDTMKNKPTLIVLHDADGHVAGSFGTSKFPETYWINFDRSIRRRWVGPQDWLSAEVFAQFTSLLTRPNQK